MLKFIFRMLQYVRYTFVYIYPAHTEHTRHTNHSASSTHRPGDDEFIAVSSSSSKSTRGHCGSWRARLQTQEDKHNLHKWISGKSCRWKHLWWEQHNTFSKGITRWFLVCWSETKRMIKCEKLCRMCRRKYFSLSVCSVYLADRRVDIETFDLLDIGSTFPDICRVTRKSKVCFQVLEVHCLWEKSRVLLCYTFWGKLLHSHHIAAPELLWHVIHIFHTVYSSIQM